jgi:hypothetical protein
MILNNAGRELMINIKTGERFTIEISREEKAEMILMTNTSEEEKIYALEALGFGLNEIFELALKLGWEQDKEEG